MASMGAKASYYLILTVYLALWFCQQVACHLTHSLIILTDSYINLYKLLEVSLGILHLRTQCKIAESKNQDEASKISLFGYHCTYQFKRLPVLGSFVNGLFLAALLMSAAIEGIQTCIHVGHSQAESERSILLEHPITYPAILIGFALVDLIMQVCLIKTHQISERELAIGKNNERSKEIVELNVDNLVLPQPRSQIGKLVDRVTSKSKFELVGEDGKGSSAAGLETLSDMNDNSSQISLKSLKPSNDLPLMPASLKTPETVQAPSKVPEVQPEKLTKEPWMYARHCTSPVALTTCALVVYFINNDMVTEVSDAFLAISVVIMIYAASYPPMKKIGKILLQSAPPGMDLEELRESFKSVSPLILELKSLHIWSLKSQGYLISSCEIVLDKRSLESEAHLTKILAELKRKSLDKNISSLTVQPVFLEPETKNEEQTQVS